MLCVSDCDASKDRSVKRWVTSRKTIMCGPDLGVSCPYDSGALGQSHTQTNRRGYGQKSFCQSQGETSLETYPTRPWSWTSAFRTAREGACFAQVTLLAMAVRHPHTPGHTQLPVIFSQREQTVPVARIPEPFLHSPQLPSQAAFSAH